MFGEILKEFKELKNEWKTSVLSIVVLGLFFYLVFFTFNRSIILDYSFYVPLLLTIPLAIGWYLISLVYSFSIWMIVFAKKDDNTTIGIIMYFALLLGILTLSIWIYILKLDKFNNIQNLNIFLSNGFRTYSILTFIVFVLGVIVYKVKKKKYGVD